MHEIDEDIFRRTGSLEPVLRNAVEKLRQPHPDQERIDAESAALLRECPYCGRDNVKGHSCERFLQ